MALAELADRPRAFRISSPAPRSDVRTVQDDYYIPLVAVTGTELRVYGSSDMQHVQNRGGKIYPGWLVVGFGASLIVTILAILALCIGSIVGSYSAAFGSSIGLSAGLLGLWATVRRGEILYWGK